MHARGTAVALILARNPDTRVRLWSAREEYGNQMRASRENVRYLPGVPIPLILVLTSREEEAVREADIWVSAIPTIHLRNTLKRFTSLATPKTAVVSLTKGIELSTFRRPSEIIAETLGTDRVVALSGPSHAEDRGGMPTSVVAAGADPLSQKCELQFGSLPFTRTPTTRGGAFGPKNVSASPPESPMAWVSAIT